VLVKVIKNHQADAKQRRNSLTNLENMIDNEFDDAINYGSIGSIINKIFSLGGTQGS